MAEVGQNPLELRLPGHLFVLAEEKYTWGLMSDIKHSCESF